MAPPSQTLEPPRFPGRFTYASGRTLAHYLLITGTADEETRDSLDALRRYGDDQGVKYAGAHLWRRGPLNVLEAIYEALFVQGRGALKRELVACLRTGRALRVPRARARQRQDGFVTPEVMISARPPDIEDRAVPGHWEGDLIIGLNKSAIGTLVERTTRFTNVRGGWSGRVRRRRHNTSRLKFWPAYPKREVIEQQKSFWSVPSKETCTPSLVLGQTARTFHLNLPIL